MDDLRGFFLMLVLFITVIGSLAIGALVAAFV